MASVFYEQIAQANAWLDESNAGMQSEVDDICRILKIAEEGGEAAQAYIGWIGQNPRKGKTHTREEVLDELADVAITAICAIQHFTLSASRTEGIVRRKMDKITKRIS